ncbi:lysozyme [Fusobacterium sp.]|uniref:lysozyme n=1 Tax=Fusobacterium sp. TaxID=68766 RepID=UPI002626957B|nr:lysozyme [Fusobacterium sp.]
MKISNEGIEFIIREEGEKLQAYRCPAGVWTIGVGHTGKDIVPNMKITKEKSRELLKTDLRHFENAVNKTIKVELEQYQFDALVSFAFNVGVNAFSNSTLAKKINAKAPTSEIESEFRKWRRGGGRVLPVLVARREREINLYKGV